MAEFSIPWAGTTPGDAGPYTDEQWSDIWRILFNIDRTTQGVLRGHANKLEVTGVSSPISVATGVAMVDGKFYENSTPLSVVVPTPAGATRIDRIVARKSWSAQTVRITRIAGVEGGGAPALVQSDGVTWDIPLAQVSITTGGVITVTDQRNWLINALIGVLLNSVGSIPYVSSANQLSVLAMGLADQFVKVNAAGTGLEYGYAGSLKAVRVYTSDDTWAKPAGLTSILIKVVGGGGGSGGANSAAGQATCTAGAGGGGYSQKFILAASLSVNETVTVGVGGTAGANTGADGTAGGASSFGSHCTGTGGALGQGSTAGMGSGSAVTADEGGAGGTASGGDINLSGQKGSYALRISASSGIAGNGGNAGGGMGVGGVVDDEFSSPGVSGRVYGGGASGAMSNNNVDNTGGAGGNGVVIVYEFGG